MPATPEIDTATTKKTSFKRPLIFILVLAGLFIAARALHLQDYLQEEKLRRFIAAYGVWGPLLFLALWTIVPCLLLPCLPLTLAGGILFGPIWGVAYVTIGSTTGASLAFLISRYLARDWVAVKLRGSKLALLDDKVAQHGWKIVAISRLIPLSPYFLLNYAFGLTRVRFFPFALATLFAMLPWTIAFVLVASNIPVLLRGEVSIWLILGVSLLALAGLLTVVYRTVKARRGESVEI